MQNINYFVLKILSAAAQRQMTLPVHLTGRTQGLNKASLTS